MHFLIPDTSENINQNGGSYTTYNLHVNGSLHCSIRYSDFYDFNEKLVNMYTTSNLPSFPPKKIFPLMGSQQETRRIALERYIQIISMNSSLKKSKLFNYFIRNAQQQMLSEDTSAVDIAVYLSNGESALVSDNLTTVSKCSDVMDAFACSLHLPKEFTRDKFSLFLVKRVGEKHHEVVRVVQDFECPAITIKLANKSGSEQTFRLMIRKSYWDPSYDDLLLENNIATNLLYTQVIHEISQKWIEVDEDQRHKLKLLRKRRSKSEFLRYCSQLKFYGYELFLSCSSNYRDVSGNSYPAAVHKVNIYIGHKDMVIRDASNESVKDMIFRVTRIRCWRLINTEDREKIDSDIDVNDQIQLKFEYLFAPDTLRWVSIYSDQAIFMSMCLQGVVNELIDSKGLPSTTTSHTGGGVIGSTVKKNNNSRVTDWALKAVGGGGGGASTTKDKHLHDHNQNQTTSDAFEGIGDDDL